MSSSQQQGSRARAPTPCAAGCDFFGSPDTLDMCSVCYKKHCAVSSAEQGAAAVSGSAVAAAPAASTTASSTAARPATGVPFAPAAVATAACLAEAAAVPSSSSAPGAAKKAQPTRCAACCKKVGLTGFVCRCQKTFCGTHRYAEEHGCSFNFKAAGRDAIARSNPCFKGEKLAVKI